MKNFDSHYISWLKTSDHMPKINLGQSGMHTPATLADIGLKPEELPLNEVGLYGLDRFKSAIAGIYNVPEKNLVIGVGASGLNFLIFSTLFDHDDKVLVESPVYDTIPFALKQLGMQVEYLPRRFENGFRIDTDEFKSLMKNDIKAVVLTDLHNPSSMKLDEDSIVSIAAICKERNAWLIIDEIYLEFFFRNRPKSAFHISDNVIVTTSLTKAFGVGWLRAGFCFAPEQVVSEAQKVGNLMWNVSPSITEHIAAEILTRPEIYDKLSAIPTRLIETNLPIVTEFIESRDDIEWVKPDGGISSFPRLESASKSKKLYEILTNEFDTFIVPGKFFFDDRSFRMSFGIPTEMLKQGLENIDTVLNRLK